MGIRIFIIAFFFPFLLKAQISRRLYVLLPDSLKPTDPLHLSFEEKEKILRNCHYFEKKTKEDYIELDSLCVSTTQQQKKTYSTEDKLKLYNLVSVYWYNRFVTKDSTIKYTSDSALKYCKLMKETIGVDTQKYESKLSKYYLLYAGIMNEKRLYAEAYLNLTRALDLCRLQKSNKYLKFIYSSIAVLYGKLQLYSQAILYTDSAIIYETNKDICSSEEYGMLMINKAGYYSNMYTSSHIKTYADSVFIFLKNFRQNSTCGDIRRAIAYSTLADLSYHQSNFKNSILFADSSILIQSYLGYTDYNVINFAYKGLSLLHLRHDYEGIQILKRINIEENDRDILSDVLEQLYLYEKKHAQYKRSLFYLEKLVVLNKTIQLNRYRGQIFELQEKYNVAYRDIKIRELQKNNAQNRMIILLIMFFLIIAIFLLHLRYKRNAERKISHAKQIKYLNELQEQQLQIVKIETEKSEQKRLGQVLHDSLSSTLASAFHSIRLKAYLEKKQESQDDLYRIADALEDSYNKARKISHEIYYKSQNDNYWNMLSKNIEAYFRNTDIELFIDIDIDQSLEVSYEFKTTLLFIIQESVANIFKHAKATSVKILLYEDGNVLVLRISDNGIFHLVQKKKNGLGLRSMKDRIEKIGGQIELKVNAV